MDDKLTEFNKLRQKRDDLRRELEDIERQIAPLEVEFKAAMDSFQVGDIIKTREGLSACVSNKWGGGTIVYRFEDGTCGADEVYMLLVSQTALAR